MDISILQDRNRQITVCGPVLSGPNNTARRLLICTSSHPYPPPKMAFFFFKEKGREGEGKKKKHTTKVLCSQQCLAYLLSDPLKKKFGNSFILLAFIKIHEDVIVSNNIYPYKEYSLTFEAFLSQN